MHRAMHHHGHADIRQAVLQTKGEASAPATPPAHLWGLRPPRTAGNGIHQVWHLHLLFLFFFSNHLARVCW